MSSIEERLAEDIAAITGGVVVTDSDLREARETVDELIIGRQKQSRRRTLAAAVAAAVAIPALGFGAFQTLGGEDKSAPPAKGGPSPSGFEPFLTGRAPTQDLVQGVWRTDNGIIAIRFSPPDRISFDSTGRLFGDPEIAGTYEIAGDRITVSVTGGSGCAGKTFSMRAALPEHGIMRIEPGQWGGTRCAPVFAGVEVLQQVLPTSQEMAEFKFPDKMDWKPPAGLPALYGMWLAEGGDYVLEIDPGGSYYVADESGEPVDRGQWSYHDAGLTLTSSADSVDCTAGDRLVLSGVEQVDPDTSGMQWTVENNPCGGAWAAKAWFLVPDEGT
jgi:hypothetical protein